MIEVSELVSCRVALARAPVAVYACCMCADLGTTENITFAIYIFLEITEGDVSDGTMNVTKGIYL